jgi:hypothetical protein
MVQPQCPTNRPRLRYRSQSRCILIRERQFNCSPRCHDLTPLHCRLTGPSAKIRMNPFRYDDNGCGAHLRPGLGRHSSAKDLLRCVRLRNAFLLWPVGAVATNRTSPELGEVGLVQDRPIEVKRLHPFHRDPVSKSRFCGVTLLVWKTCGARPAHCDFGPLLHRHPRRPGADTRCPADLTTASSSCPRKNKKTITGQRWG